MTGEMACPGSTVRPWAEMLRLCLVDKQMLSPASTALTHM